MTTRRLKLWKCAVALQHGQTAMARYIFAFLGVFIIPLERTLLIHANTRQRRPRPASKVLPLVVALSILFALVESICRIIMEILFVIDRRFDERGCFKFFVRFAFRWDTNKLHFLTTDAARCWTLYAPLKNIHSKKKTTQYQVKNISLSPLSNSSPPRFRYTEFWNKVGSQSVPDPCTKRDR